MIMTTYGFMERFGITSRSQTLFGLLGLLAITIVVAAPVVDVVAVAAAVPIAVVVAAEIRFLG